MQERINYQKICKLADRKHSWVKYLFGVAMDVGDQGANNRHYIANILFPLIPIALVSISAVVAGVTALSTFVFGAMAFITSAYQAKRTKEGMEARTTKLKKEIAAFEEEIIELVRLYQALETQRQAKKLSDEAIDEEQKKIVETFYVLLDRIDLDKKSRSEKLYQLLQHRKTDEISATLDQIGLKMMLMRVNQDDQSIQSQLSKILSGIEKPKPMNPHVRRSLGALVLFGGFSLGFGLGFAAVSALVILTFPWSILPAVGAGLVVASLFFARYHFVKRGTERDQGELKLAKGQVKGLRGFVSKICNDIKNKCTHLLDREAAKEEKAQELQAQVEEEKVTVKKAREEIEQEKVSALKRQDDLRREEEESKAVIRQAQEEVERKELVLVKEKEGMEEQKRILNESQLKLYQSIKVFNEVKDKFGDEKSQLEEKWKLLENKEHLFEEKRYEIEAEKEKAQQELMKREQLVQEKEALLVVRERGISEKERLVNEERSRKIAVHKNRGTLEKLKFSEKTQKIAFFDQCMERTNNPIKEVDESQEEYAIKNI